MKKYKVLWIDDEYERLSGLITRCELMFDMEITTCRFAKEGMIIFEKNLEQWSAVILDGNVLMESLNEIPDLKGMSYCRDRINELRKRRFVPTFIFTGADGLVGSVMFESFVGKYYTKGIDDDNLIKDLIEAAGLSIETQIRDKYEDALTIFPEIEAELMPILKALEQDDVKNSSVMNSVRKILEFLATTFYERGITEVSFQKTNLAECSRDLGSTDIRAFVPSYIQRSFHLCCELTNEGSHRDTFDQRIKIGEAPYAVKSTIYCLLNILQWCKSLPEIENAEAVRAIISEQRQAKRQEEEEKRNKFKKVQ